MADTENTLRRFERGMAVTMNGDGSRVRELEDLLIRSRAEADNCVRAGHLLYHNGTLCDDISRALKARDEVTLRTLEENPQ